MKIVISAVLRRCCSASNTQSKLYDLLITVSMVQDNTMLVQGQRSFSHEEFRAVVYSKYIRSPETMVRLHMQMARYFARLPASDRKVKQYARI